VNNNQQTNIQQNYEKFTITSKRPFPTQCLPCHLGELDLCCSCAEIYDYYAAHKIENSSPDESAQCIREEEYRKAVFHEGCKINGRIQVPKIGGNFHIAPGLGAATFGGHSHTLHPLTFTADLEKTKLSHSIHKLSFGPPYPGMTDPLTGVEFSTDKLVRHIYYIRLVPTVYIDGSNIIHTYQYSVTNHTDVVNLGTFSLQLPGIFFKYDFSPMLVQLERREKYFTHFLTRLCAIIGGTWVVLGLIYSSLQSAVDHLKKKRIKADVIVLKK